MLLRKDGNEEYQVCEKLGEGAYGAVYRGVRLGDNMQVAIKELEISPEDLLASHDSTDAEAEDRVTTAGLAVAKDSPLHEIMKEVVALKQLHHENVTLYLDSFVQSTQNVLWIVQEYCYGGSCHDLLSVIQHMEEDQVRCVVRDTLKGLQYLHGLRLIHRDIKAANILLSADGVAKLGDFGVSGQLSNTMSQRHTIVGSPFWLAPEVIAEVGYRNKIDLWSLGITCIELAEGAAPLTDLHPMRALFLIPSSPPPKLKEEGKWSVHFRSFVERCLVKDPDDRADADELLAHPFIASVSEQVYEAARRALIEAIKRKKELVSKRRPSLMQSSSPSSSTDSHKVTTLPTSSKLAEQTPPQSQPPPKQTSSAPNPLIAATSSLAVSSSTVCEDDGSSSTLTNTTVPKNIVAAGLDMIGVDQLELLKSELIGWEEKFGELKDDRMKMKEDLESLAQQRDIAMDEVGKLKSMVIQLNLERAQYRHHWFLSCCLALKLQAQVLGWPTVNISSGDLWEMVESLHVPESKWQDWITMQLQPHK